MKDGKLTMEEAHDNVFWYQSNKLNQVTHKAATMLEAAYGVLAATGKLSRGDSSLDVIGESLNILRRASEQYSEFLRSAVPAGARCAMPTVVEGKEVFK